MFGSRGSPAPASAAVAATAPVGGVENRFSLVHLRQLHQQLVENKELTDDNENIVVEILRVIAEMVVYGDNKSEMLFDFFCEKNMLSLFLQLMWSENGCPAAVHIQILQTLSILISCVRNDTSLYYLLSNNYINEIIEFPHNFSMVNSGATFQAPSSVGTPPPAPIADENLCDQFASFIKTLSLRLNFQTVQFFFIEETGSFPLLGKAISLLGSTEQMVRISAQTVILNVLRVDSARARMYALQDEEMHRLFSRITNLMELQFNSVKKLCVQFYGPLVSEDVFSLEATFFHGPTFFSSSSSGSVACAIFGSVPTAGLRPSSFNGSTDRGLAPAGQQKPQPQQGSRESAARASHTGTRPSTQVSTPMKTENLLEDAMSTMEDWFYYLQDLFELGIPKLSKALVHYFMSELFYPVLIRPIVDATFHVNNNTNSSSLSADQQNAEVLRIVQRVNISVATMYIIQLSRIVVDATFQGALLTALYHPLSMQTRVTLVSKIVEARILQENHPSHAGHRNRDVALSNSNSSRSSSREMGVGEWKINLCREAITALCCHAKLANLTSERTNRLLAGYSSSSISSAPSSPSRKGMPPSHNGEHSSNGNGIGIGAINGMQVGTVSLFAGGATAVRGAGGGLRSSQRVIILSLALLHLLTDNLANRDQPVQPCDSFAGVGSAAAAAPTATAGGSTGESGVRPDADGSVSSTGDYSVSAYSKTPTTGRRGAPAAVGAELEVGAGVEEEKRRRLTEKEIAIERVLALFYYHFFADHGKDAPATTAASADTISLRLNKAVEYNAHIAPATNDCGKNIGEEETGENKVAGRMKKNEKNNISGVDGIEKEEEEEKGPVQMMRERFRIREENPLDLKYNYQPDALSLRTLAEIEKRRFASFQTPSLAGGEESSSSSSSSSNSSSGSGSGVRIDSERKDGKEEVATAASVGSSVFSGGSVRGSSSGGTMADVQPSACIYLIYVHVLSVPQQYSLTAIQLAVHALYSLACVLQAARACFFHSETDTETDVSMNMNMNMGVSKTANGAAATADSAKVRGEGTQEELEEKWEEQGRDQEGLRKSVDRALEDLAAGVREAARLSAAVLLRELDGVHREIFLQLLLEETRRFQGRKWKPAVSKLYRELLLLTPEGDPHNSARLGPDFALPDTPIDALRKDIQTFLMLRALCKQIQRFVLVPSMQQFEGELCSSIDDSSFLCLDENTILATTSVGDAFDMRGKRFLDVRIIPPPFPDSHLSSSSTGSASASGSDSYFSPDGSAAAGGAVAGVRFGGGGGGSGGGGGGGNRRSLSGALSPYNVRNQTPTSEGSKGAGGGAGGGQGGGGASSSLLSNAASIFSLGYYHGGGSGHGSAAATTAPGSGNTKRRVGAATEVSDLNSPPGPGSGSRSGERAWNLPSHVMFLQDPILLQLVAHERVNRTNTFKFYVVAPLLYADAQVSRENRRQFSILVRSWRKTVENMFPLPHPLEEGLAGIDAQGEDGGSGGSMAVECGVGRPERAAVGSGSGSNGVFGGGVAGGERRSEVSLAAIYPNRESLNSPEDSRLAGSGSSRSAAADGLVQDLDVTRRPSDGSNNIKTQFIQNVNSKKKANTIGGAITSTSHNETLGYILNAKNTNFRKAEPYLLPREGSDLWELTLLMETEQSCALAVQHIEARRQKIFTEKVLKLKAVLASWMSDSDIIAKDC